MPVDKIVVRKQPGVQLWKAYTVVEGRKPMMRPLSLHGVSKTMAQKQKTAVQLSELRAAGRLPKQKAAPKKKK